MTRISGRGAGQSKPKALLLLIAAGLIGCGAASNDNAALVSEDTPQPGAFIASGAKAELWGGVYHGMTGDEVRTARPNVTTPTAEQLNALHLDKRPAELGSPCPLYEEDVRLVGRAWRVCYILLDGVTERINLYSDVTGPGAFESAFLEFQNRYGDPLRQLDGPLLKATIQLAEWKDGRRLIRLGRISGPGRDTLTIDYSVASDEI